MDIVAEVGEGSPRRDLGCGGDVARASWRCDQVYLNDASPCPGGLPRRLESSCARNWREAHRG